MAQKIQVRRGTDAQRQGVVFDQGELVWTIDTKKLYVGDGETAGGIEAWSAADALGLVSVPVDQDAAGNPGDVAADATGFYIYIGDGDTHAWLQIAGATQFDNS